ncbi:hypothetical protein PIROE2DRAFT_11130 [Piromyces sp. E2]|nr:hypothetical protein PIROE2DRAFT_11130 [Piromyces sp. E2]|eukprot:OUM62549.1 hypothetical protein PIROE2DRAFT_11130 [Piromyces sp. E2]
MTTLKKLKSLLKDFEYNESSDEDKVVQFCRLIFEEDYKNYWIDVDLDEIEEDNRYVFNYVSVDLYPKTIKLGQVLRKMGIKIPKMKKYTKPLKPSREDYSIEEYWEQLNEYSRKMQNFKEKYREQVYKIIHQDIDKQKRKGVKPISIVIEIRNNKIFIE